MICFTVSGTRRSGASAVPDSSAVLLVGGGGHCRALIDVLEAANIPVAGIVHGPDCDLRAMSGYPPLGRDTELADLRRRFRLALVSVGQIKTSSIRRKLFMLLLEHGFELPVVRSPYAYVSSHAQLGRGSVVMHHALVNAGASIGENCIINSKALIEHDCTIEAHCHIAVGAMLCGGVRVAEGSFIGAGSICREGVCIGSGVIVGCGSVILKDVPDGAIIKGR